MRALHLCCLERDRIYTLLNSQLIHRRFYGKYRRRAVQGSPDTEVNWQIHIRVLDPLVRCVLRRNSAFSHARILC